MTRRRHAFAYGAITHCGQASKPVRPARRFITPPRRSGNGTHAPTTPHAQPPEGITRTRFSHPPLSLATTHGMSFPAGTEMFHFPAYPPRHKAWYPPMTAGGFPHSETPGSKPGWRLPGAYRCLQRPSSVPCAKASTMSPYRHDDPRPKGREPHRAREKTPQQGPLIMPDDNHHTDDHKRSTPAETNRRESGKITTRHRPPKTGGRTLARVHYPVLKPPRATRSAEHPTDVPATPHGQQTAPQ